MSSGGATRYPAGPAAYHVIGGGCFGSFYVRQLLRYADRAGGPVARIVVVDRDPDCRVARTVADPRVELAVADWVDHLGATLPPTIDAVARGETVRDRLVPSPFASHILLAALGRVAAPGVLPAGADAAARILAGIATPFARDLGTGNVALSFATWVCPVNCIEPATCPAIAAPLDWNMARAVRAHVAGCAEVASLAILECLHEAYGVGTIPLADIARAALEIGSARAGAAGAACDATPGAASGEEPGAVPRYAVVATVSTCHGLAGALRLTD
jgi:hypothetical protein